MEHARLSAPPVPIGWGCCLHFLDWGHYYEAWPVKGYALCSSLPVYVDRQAGEAMPLYRAFGIAQYFASCESTTTGFMNSTAASHARGVAYHDQVSQSAPCRNEVHGALVLGVH